MIIVILNSHVDAREREWNLLFVFRHKTSSASQNNYMLFTSLSTSKQEIKNPGKKIGLNPGL